MKVKAWIASGISLGAVILGSVCLSLIPSLLGAPAALLLAGLIAGLLPAIYSLVTKGFGGIGIRLSHAVLAVALAIVSMVVVKDVPLNYTQSFINTSVNIGDIVISTLGQPVFLLLLGYMLGSAVYERDETVSAFDASKDWFRSLLIVLMVFLLVAILYWLSIFTVSSGVNDQYNVLDMVHSISTFLLLLSPFIVGLIPVDWRSYRNRRVDETAPFRIVALLSLLVVILMGVVHFSMAFPTVLKAEAIAPLRSIYDALFFGNGAFGYALMVVATLSMRRFSDANARIRHKAAPKAAAAEAASSAPKASADEVSTEPKE